MNPTLLFFHMLYNALHQAGGCYVATESTHSTEATRGVIVYGGSCIQSLLYVLSLPGHGLAYILNGP